MRIGNWLGGAVGWTLVAAAAALFPAPTRAAERVRAPLGGALADLSGDRDFAVYVPTRFGGVLTLKASSGRVESIVGPDGQPRRNGEEVGSDKQGWYTFQVKGAEKPYRVETEFVQVGQAARMPWNFYYWPT